MKKLIAPVLILVCVLVLVGCSSDRCATPDDATDGYTYIVMEVTESYLLIAEIGEDGKAVKTKQYHVPNLFHPSTEIKVDSRISITHSGSILETYPMQFAEIYKMEYYDKETGLSTVIIPD